MLTMRIALRMLWWGLLLGLSAGSTAMGCSDATGPGGGCCKVCKTGKACGDTCIDANDRCTKSGGCACNG